MRQISIKCGCDGRNNSTTTITVTLHLLYSIYLLITINCIARMACVIEFDYISNG